MTEPVRLHPGEIDAIARRLLELLRDEGALGVAPIATADELLTAAEVARRFSVDRSWIYAHADELGALRLGDGARPRLRFHHERVAEVLRARTSSEAPPQRRAPSWRPAVDVRELGSDPLGVLPERWRKAAGD